MGVCLREVCREVDSLRPIVLSCPFWTTHPSYSIEMSGVFVPRPAAFAILGILLCDVTGSSVDTVQDTSLGGAKEVLMRRVQMPTTRVVSIGEHGNFHNPLAPNELLEVSDRSQSSSHLSTWQQALKEDPALFAGCSSIFLDVGSNRGTHVRKLFEPEKYPGCPYLKVIEKGFGAAEKRARPFKETGICTFGFEANPRWASTLKQLEEAYTAQGWRVKWFAPEAVGVSEGNVDYWHYDHDSNSDLGFSMRKRSAGSTEVTVPSIDFSAFVEELHKNAPSGYRLMKMDIESAEFTVLPKFVTNQLLCKNVMDTITIEWHDRFLKTEASKEQAKQLESQVMSPNKCTSGPSTTVLDLDDESYAEDGKPLPGH